MKKIGLRGILMDVCNIVTVPRVIFEERAALVFAVLVFLISFGVLFHASNFLWWEILLVSVVAVYFVFVVLELLSRIEDSS